MGPKKLSTCMVPGPWVRTSPSYESQVHCNRVQGHELPHRFYNGSTFAVIAEWEIAEEPADQTRRRVDDYEAMQHEAAARAVEEN
jgi:hypothetical protein